MVKNIFVYNYSKKYLKSQSADNTKKGRMQYTGNKNFASEAKDWSKPSACLGS